ncbi:MAG: hypothetical protein JRG96_01690 [Deltaproteobacteria bacterium]|nr:hypothetical protein [Deltaproteobacteria bacterium]MBW2417565.1 hypothetical protein [Deltaproteobacteria bacterium]
MMFRLGIFLLIAAAWGCERFQPPSGEYTASHPQLIALALPELAASNQPGTTEALAHLELALSDVVRCLEMDDLEIAMVYQPQIQVHYLGDTHSFGFADPAAQDATVAVVLVATDRPPVGVYPQMGSRSLHRSLRDAVADYFGKERCRIER